MRLDVREALEAHAGGRRARIGAVLHQVLEAEGDRVHAHRLGTEIDQALGDGRRDRVADRAVLAGRHLVLEHDRGLGAVVGEVVGAAHQVDDLVAFHRAGAGIDRVGADAGQVVDVEGGDAPLRVDGHAALDAVVARVDVGGEALQAIGDELDRSAHDLGDHRHRDLVRVDVHLDAVAAADIAADDAHGAERQLEVPGQHLLHHVRRLRRMVDGERGVALVELGEDRARLQRHAGVATGVEGRLDDLVRASEGVGDVAALVDALEDEVVAEIGMDDRRCLVEGRLHVGDRREHLPGDRDLGCGVLGGGAAVGHDGGDRLAGPGRRRERQRQLRGRLHALEVGENGHPGLAVRSQVLAGEDAQHAGDFERGVRIDPADLRVRMRAAHERDMHHARQHEVIDVLPAPLDELARIGARDRSPDVGVRPVDGAGVDHRAHGLPAPELADPGLGHRLDRVDDGVIAGAATVVARQMLADGRRGRARCRPRRRRAAARRRSAACRACNSRTGRRCGRRTRPADRGSRRCRKRPRWFRPCRRRGWLPGPDSRARSGR